MLEKATSLYEIELDEIGDIQGQTNKISVLAEAVQVLLEPDGDDTLGECIYLMVGDAYSAAKEIDKILKSVRGNDQI